jgi:hypothetical protein
MKKYLLKCWVLILLSLMGCQQALKEDNSILAEKFNSVPSIREYLSAHVASTGFGGEPYCAYEVLDAEQNDEAIALYLWVVCQEYYLEQQAYRQGTGASLPAALVVHTRNESIQVVGHRVPRDGALYAEDMPVIFSEKFISKVQAETTDDQNGRVERLKAEIQQFLNTSADR